MTSTPAGDFDYEVHGHDYALRRHTDPRIAALVHEALGRARTVLNLGAGAGSYEPEDRYVVAVEPSAAMRAQRPRHLSPAMDTAAEDLPFERGPAGAWDERYGAWPMRAGVRRGATADRRPTRA
jgi:hypothetical protein